MPKKDKKCPKRTGRPADAYSKMTAEQKRTYHAQAGYASKAKRDTSEHSEPSTSRTPEKRRSVGRPPLNDTVMTPNTLKGRKRELTARKMHSEKVSKARKKAAEVRWQHSDSEEPMDPSAVTEPEEVAVSSTSKDTTDSESSGQYSNRKFRRMKTKLVAMLPKSPLDNLHVFIKSLSNVSGGEKIKADGFQYLERLSARQRRYRAQRIKSVTTECSKEMQVDLLKYWLDKLLSDRYIANILDAASVIIPEELWPKCVLVSRISSNLSSKYLHVHCVSLS